MPVGGLEIAFLGTAGFGLPALDALVRSRHTVKVVYTQPARPAGRGQKPKPSKIAQAAIRHGLPLRTPKTLREPAEQAAFAEFGLDLAVVAAYGLILPAAILGAPRLGCINLHASALPRWRGAAPIQRAILAGDSETGLTVIEMEPSLDTGPMLALERIPIGAEEDAGTLHDRLASLAAELVLPVIDDLAAGRAVARPQPEAGVTYAHKIDKAETRLDWSEPAVAVGRRVRAFSPVPGAFTEQAGERLRILAGNVVPGEGPPGSVLDDRLTIACGAGAFRPSRVQQAGGRALPTETFLRGHPVPVGTRLGASCPATS